MERIIPWAQYESECLSRCSDEAQRRYSGRDLSETKWHEPVPEPPKVAKKATKQKRLEE